MFDVAGALRRGRPLWPLRPRRTCRSRGTLRTGRGRQIGDLALQTADLVLQILDRLPHLTERPIGEPSGNGVARPDQTQHQPDDSDHEQLFLRHSQLLKRIENELRSF